MAGMHAGQMKSRVLLLQCGRQGLQRPFISAQQKMAQTRILRIRPHQGFHQVRPAHAFGAPFPCGKAPVQLPHHRHSVRANHVHPFQHGPITPVMNAEGYHVRVRGGHQARGLRFQGTFRQGRAHFLHGADGHGKAEHLSGLARHPRAGLVRIVCSSHGLMEMKGENHGRDSLSPS